MLSVGGVSGNAREGYTLTVKIATSAIGTHKTRPWKLPSELLPGVSQYSGDESVSTNA